MSLMKKLCFILGCALSLHAAEEYEEWWEKCLGGTVSIEDFAGWLGDLNSPSRVLMRDHVRKKGYRSLLDVPAGLCIDYFGLKRDGLEIDYMGVDITPKLVFRAQLENIPVCEGDIKHLPFEDNRFEISYARHILEHLSGYEEAVSELIRVASRETLIVFFIAPTEGELISSSLFLGHLLHGNLEF